ncbi:DUF2982 domain-containing protein [Thalassotalea sp. PLHSN55]|uniref:DUF2982 domain-containing protein n=1 Tax=Thalassotalea sp. PLHSN55 TaxID=3435888 RepID=UPI003F82CCC0
MNLNSQKLIEITPIAKNHQYFLLVLGALLLAICLLLNRYFWSDFKLQLMFIMFASFIIFLLGLMKVLSPKISFQLTPASIKYFHSHGQWQISWPNIVRIDSVQAFVQGQFCELPYVGIKLTSLSAIADNISPRLANKLLHEQQELIHLAIKNNELSLEQGIIDFSPYQGLEKTYKGPVAAWLHRSEQLCQAYGFHLFLPKDNVDRDIKAFVKLLRQCQKFSNNN